MFLINRIPSPLLENVSPFEKLLKKKPDYSVLRTFGCQCYASTILKDRNKFSPRAQSCVFLGYPSGYKGYKVLDLITNSVSITRNVVFHENVFPFASNQNTETDLFSHTILPASVPYIPEFEHSNNSDLSHSSSLAPVSNDIPSSSSDISSSSSHLPIDSHAPFIPSHGDSRATENETVVTDTTLISLPSDRPKRQTRTPSYLSEYHCALAQISPSLPPKYTTPYPLSSYLSYNHFTPTYCSYILSYSMETEPKTFKQAMASEVWK